MHVKKASQSIGIAVGLSGGFFYAYRDSLLRQDLQAVVTAEVKAWNKERKQDLISREALKTFIKYEESRRVSKRSEILTGPERSKSSPLGERHDMIDRGKYGGM